MALKMTRKKWAILIVAVALILAKAAAVFRPGFPITISKETTYITEPLRPDGFPDYIAALNQLSSESVTPENNFTTLFWQAVGPAEISPDHREEYFRLLGIPLPPEQGDYFITDAEHEKRIVARRMEQKQADDDLSKEDISKQLWEQFDSAVKRPWAKQEFPEWAEWIDLNEKPLVMLVEATKRPRRYDPLVGDCLISASLTGAQYSRDVARTLVLRAMLRLNEGKTEEAWEYLLACHRLARLIGQGPTLVEALVAITIDGMACKGDVALLGHGKLDAHKIAQMREQCDAFLELPSMIEKIDLGERLFCLDTITALAREGPDAIDDGEKKPEGSIASFKKSSSIASIDWDYILRMQNEYLDCMVDACRKPTRSKRMEAISLLDEKINREIEASRNWKNMILAAIFNTRKARSKMICQMMTALLMPAASAAIEASDRMTMQSELTDLAFALSAHRAENGAYPEKLAELIPKYIKSVPVDIFNHEAELKYSKIGDGFLLYSVGPNGTDDGGKTYDDCKEGESWDDISVRISRDKSGK